MTDSPARDSYLVTRSWHRLVALVLIAWAVKWAFGPVIFVLQAGASAAPRPEEPLLRLAAMFPWVSHSAGALLVVATLVIGVLLLVRRDPGVRAARWLLGAVIVFKLVMVLVPTFGNVLVSWGNILAVMHKLPGAVMSGMITLGDIGCAAALLWFLGRMVAPPRTEAADAPPPARPALAPIVTLAILFLVFREGLRVVLLPMDLGALREAVQGFPASPGHALMLAVGVIASTGAVALVAGRLAGARSLVGPAMMLMLLGMVRLVMLLAVSGAMGDVMRAGLYASTAAGLLEYGLLMAHLPDR